MTVTRPLFAFAMNSMLAFGRTVLFQLNAIRVVTLVLHRHVILALAAGASQGDLFTHNVTSLKKADWVGLES